MLLPGGTPFFESELLVEATGEETAQTNEAGALIIHRRDDCTVFLNEEEMGFLSICTEFSLKEQIRE